MQPKLEEAVVYLSPLLSVAERDLVARVLVRAWATGLGFVPGRLLGCHLDLWLKVGLDLPRQSDWSGWWLEVVALRVSDELNLRGMRRSQQR